MMAEWIDHLKQVVIIVLVCEFLKELLSTSSFRKYVQFAVSLFLFFFLFSSLFRLDFSFSLPDISIAENESENLLVPEYEARISERIHQELSQNNLSVQNVTVKLSDQYEIKSVTIFSKDDPEKIKATLKGDFSCEVVPPDEEILDR